MEESKGLLFMAALIIFILLSQFIFTGNPLDMDEDCPRYSHNNAEC